MMALLLMPVSITLGISATKALEDIGVRVSPLACGLLAGVFQVILCVLFYAYT